MGGEGRGKQGKMVRLFYKLCRWVGVVSSVYYIYAGSLVLNTRRGEVCAKVKMRPIRLHGLQRHAEYKVTGREIPFMSPSKGLRIRRYPGGGRHKRTAVLSRRCGPAEGQRMDGRVPGWADALGQQLSMLRARQREGQKSVGARVEGSWANRGRRQEEVSIGSASTSYLPVYPALLWWVGGREAGCGLGGQSLGIVVCRPTRPMAGVAV